jgi:hypothetical protein
MAISHLTPACRMKGGVAAEAFSTLAVEAGARQGPQETPARGGRDRAAAACTAWADATGWEGRRCPGGPPRRRAYR